MSKPIWDMEKGGFLTRLSGNMAMDADGDLMLRISDNMALDLDSGDLHFTSSWTDDAEDDN